MKKLVLYIFMGTCLMVTAQSKEEKANAYFEDFKFDKAIELYSNLAAEKKRPSLDVIQHLADSYFNINSYQEAVQWYEKLYTIKGKDVGESNIIKLVQSHQRTNPFQASHRGIEESNSQGTIPARPQSGDFPGHK